MTTERIRVTGHRRAEVDLDRLTAAFLAHLVDTLSGQPDEANESRAVSSPGVAS